MVEHVQAIGFVEPARPHPEDDFWAERRLAFLTDEFTCLREERQPWELLSEPS